LTLSAIWTRIKSEV